MQMFHVFQSQDLIQAVQSYGLILNIQNMDLIFCMWILPVIL